MMDEFRFYLSVFLRRLPWFLIVATVISGLAAAMAMTLPPAYVSQMRLVVESPQIPEELAQSTVRTPALEQLQIIEQRLLTRANLLDIARRLEVLPDLDQMNPDEIVSAMRARTAIRTTSGRNAATLTRVSFEAPNPAKAAGVLNEYLTLIQEADAEFRRGRAGETLDFFAQEVARLGNELDSKSAEILVFKQENSGALPDTLDFRLSQRSAFQERLLLVDRDITRLRNQRDRLMQLYEVTGTAGAPAGAPQSAAEAQLQQLESELSAALAVFSEENFKVKLLRSQIENLEAQIAAEQGLRAAAADEGEATEAGAEPSLLEIQLAEIDGEIEILIEQRLVLQAEIDRLEASIGRTPEVSIALDELERAYQITETQYNAAEERLARAQTGDLIESRSRGQRISVIEQPNVPSEPTKPNRVRIAAAGGVLGIAAGLALVLLLELLNGAVRRPEDLEARFGISPFVTIPYIRTRKQVFWQRSVKILFALSILVGIPAIIYAVHIYYLPIDLLADRVMNRLGVRF